MSSVCVKAVQAGVTFDENSLIQPKTPYGVGVTFNEKSITQPTIIPSDTTRAPKLGDIGRTTAICNQPLLHNESKMQSFASFKSRTMDDDEDCCHDYALCSICFCCCLPTKKGSGSGSDGSNECNCSDLCV